MTHIDQSTVRALHEAGMLRSKYLDYQKAFSLYCEKLENGKNSTQAFTEVGEEIGMSESTVIRAIRTMKQIK